MPHGFCGFPALQVHSAAPFSLGFLAVWNGQAFRIVFVCARKADKTGERQRAVFDRAVCQEKNNRYLCSDIDY